MSDTGKPVLSVDYNSQIGEPVKVLAFSGQTSLSQNTVDNFPVHGFTCSLWIKTAVTGTQDMIFSYDAADIARRLWMKNSANLEIGFGSSSTGATEITVNDNYWHHLAFTVYPADGTHYGVQIYKDGILMFENIRALSHAESTCLESGGKLEIGHGVGTEPNFTGGMSDFRLWNTVRQGKQIITDMQVRMNTSTALVIYWKLESPETSGEIVNGSFADADLSFRNNLFMTSWTQVSGSTYNLEVTGVDEYFSFIKEGLTVLQQEVTGYSLNTGYQAKVRAVTAGTPGEWSDPQTVRVLNLQKTRPKISKADDHTLNAVWAPVDQAESYTIRQKNEKTGVSETLNQTGTTYQLTNLAQSADPYTFQVQAFSRGSTGTFSDVVSFTAPTMVFACGNDPSGLLLQASWTQLLGANNYYLQVFKGSLDTPPVYDMFTDQGTTSIKITSLELKENDVYLARLRAVGIGRIGEWSPVQEVTVHGLATPVTAFAFDSGLGQVKLQWTDIRTPEQKEAGLEITYNVYFYKNNSPDPMARETTKNLFYVLADSIMADNSIYAIKVQGTAAGSYGNWSAVGQANTPAITNAWYDYNSGGITIQYTGISDTQGYLEVFKNQGTAPDYRAFSDKAQSLTYTPAGTANNDVYIPQIRGMAAGYMTKYSENNPSVTICQLVGPLITSASGSASKHSVTAAWSFDEAGLTGISYNVELWDSNKTQRLLNQTVTAKTYTFQDAGVINSGNVYNVRVQAVKGASLGRWSGFTAVGIDVPKPVTNITLKADNQANITVNYTSGESDAAYQVKIFISGTEKKTRQTTSLSVVFPPGETGVKAGNTYDVKVQIVTIKGSESSNIAEKSQNLKIEGTGGDDPPSGGDPINLVTGSYTYSHCDLEVPSIEPLQFVAFYKTDVPLPGESSYYNGKPLGDRWNHAYNIRIAFTADRKQLGVIWGDNRVDTYAVPDSITGNYPPLNARRGYNLVYGSDQYFVLSVKNQYFYRLSSDGRLISITSPAGNVVSLNYNGLQLVKVQLDAAHYLTLDYYPGGFIKTVADNAGRSITYEYQNNNLVSVTDVMGKKRTFEYYDKSLIKSITDENGHTFIQNEYDGDNRVVSQKDARAVASGDDYGVTVKYTSVKENNLDMVIADYTDRGGCTARYKSYRASSNLKEVTIQLGDGKIRKLSKVYDAYNNLLSETIYEGLESQYQDGQGNPTTYTYDNNNNLLTRQDALGQTTSYIYDDLNNLVKEVDILGNTTVYHYDGHLLTKITDPLQRDISIEYCNDGMKGLISSLADVNGNTFAFKYVNGYLSEARSPLGGKRTFENDDLGRVLVDIITDSQGNLMQKIKYEYLADGRWQKRSVMFGDQPEAAAYTTSYTYDAVGNLTSECDAADNVMTYQYDPNDLLQKIIYPASGGLNRETTYHYDNNDHLQEIMYAGDVIQQYQYDAFNRLRQFTDANHNIYAKDYEQNYLPDKAYTTNEVTTFPLTAQETAACTEVQTYDPAGRLTAVQSRSGRRTMISYDKEEPGGQGVFNRVVTWTLPALEGQAAGYTIVKKYDPVGRLIYEKNEAGNVTSITYSLQNDEDTATQQEVATRTDSLGIQKISVRDALGRLVKVCQGKDSLWHEFRYEYDALGRIISAGEVNAAGLVATKYLYRYDEASGRLWVSQGRPGDDQSMTVFEFNGLGQLVKETDPLSRSASRTYTPWGDIGTYTNGRNQAVTYNYDAAGRFTGMILPEAQGAITHKLDGNGNRLETCLNNVKTIQRTFDTWNRMTSREDSESRKVSYHFTPDDQVDLLTYTDNKQVRYLYDNLGRMAGVTDWNNRTTLYRYDPAGQVQEINYPNSCLAALEFDAGGRLTGMVHKKDDIIIASSRYTLDALGNIESCQAVNPLSPGPLAQPFNASYNAGNQMLTFNSQSLSYDDDGNLLTLPTSGGMGTVAYDWLNRVSGVNHDAYTYDADGLRTSMTVNGVTNKFIYDINGFSSPLLNLPENNGEISLIAQEDFTGTLAMQPAREPLFNSLERLLELRDAQGNILHRYVYGNGLISQESDDGTYRAYAFDPRGSVVALTDENGRITDRYAYDTWGNMSNFQGNSFNPFLYNGIYGVYSDGNGLQYMRARSYAPHLGRFLQKDFIPGNLMEPQSLNRYAFVRGNPLALIDPLGLFWKDLATGFGIGAAIGIGAGLFIAAGLVIGFGATIGGGAVGGAIGGAIGGVIAGPVGAVVGGTFGGVIGAGTGAGISNSGVATTYNWFTRFTSRISNLFRSFRYTELPQNDYVELAEIHPHSL